MCVLIKGEHCIECLWGVFGCCGFKNFWNTLPPVLFSYHRGEEIPSSYPLLEDSYI